MADRKADQISSHFYTKLFYVVLEGRDQSQQQQQDQVQGLSESKVDKWVRLLPIRPKGNTYPILVQPHHPDSNPTGAHPAIWN